MRRFPAYFVLLSVLALATLALQASAQDGPPGGDRGGPPRREGGGPGGPGGPGGGFHLIPRFAVDKLKFTDEQQKQIADLEKETKEKLYKILTPEQQKILEEARPPRPGQGGPGGPGGSGGPGGPGGGRRGPGAGSGRGGPGGDQGRGGSSGDQPARPQRPAPE